MAPTGHPPSVLSLDLFKYPKLDAKQAGHLRHYHNLVSQPDGDWSHFDASDGHEEFDDARRYQLATMAYAAGAAHYHRLPALRGPFKRLMHRMIQKMLRREVWSYWYLASHSGKLFDPSLTDLRKPWADPVVKENIMYSGHLLLMTSLYAMLFDDDEFEKEGGLTFRWDPLFWGLGAEDFVYDNRSLQKVILEQLVANDWVGVCCEPNAVFVVCNQFPLIAMRYNDIRDGTNYVEDDILPRYKKALTEKGMLGADGLYASFFAIKQKKSVPARQGAHTAWANAFMNSWNSDYVRKSYEQQTLGFLTHFGGKTQLNPTSVAITFRRLVLEEGCDQHDRETLGRARKESLKVKSMIPYETLNWLSFTMMLSELGKRKELDDLLQHADEHLSPTWEKGGLYYPRNTKVVDENWNHVHMEPHSGNSGIGYARLNVPDGQKKMWEKPWTSELLTSRPWIDGAGFEDGADFLRGIWDADERAMILTLKTWQEASSPITLMMRNAHAGSWCIYVNGKLKEVVEASKTGEVTVLDIDIHGEVDIVLKWVD
ncbi:hypothetical protein LTR97_012005 [Elasticomyces elasticus]|uniref:Linalool dehydratase/isomerase domain-containing protein n=1 Tax=Elasticomyces elasticus TaxID=574655 RepID=A0AAN7VY99_9PEZI|nr:hypothetical protein LTR97_012005 [Elasticomyces elasticus]KAK5717781.1 hypothetical protein LTR15_008620 [Elasticomyces elasticus]